MLHQDSEAELPEWLDDFVGERPLIWVYCGNPRYGSYAQWADSIVILKAVFEGLADHEARVLLTTGFQKWPSTRPPLPENFRQTVFLPGVPLAKRSALMIHHGGHNSCLTGAFTGTPALIVPTFTERESNARRVADLGVAQILMPQEDGWGEKYLCPTELRETVDSMLSDSAWTRRAEEFAQTMQKPGRLEDAADRIEALL
jgi:UDP:flavonoid glycosyltransferase YjiC (YdhE family)